MKWEKNISITSLNRFNYVLVLNQLEELLSNIKTEVTTLTLTLVHLTPVSGRLAKKKPDIIPAVHPRTNRRAEMRLQGKGNHLQTEMSPVNAAAKTTGQPAPLLPKKSASPSLTIQYRIFYEARRLLKWDCWREAKTTSSENSTLAAPAAKETQCHYHRSWHRCWCDSHSINSRNLLPLLAQITGLSGTELHCYIYIPYYTCRVCWIACYLITIMLLLLRVNTIWGVKCL